MWNPALFLDHLVWVMHLGGMLGSPHKQSQASLPASAQTRECAAGVRLIIVHLICFASALNDRML